MKKLFFGDNLEIMKLLYRQNPNGFINLIYIDPPFNSKRNYNVLFEDIDFKDTKAQKEAFADTWSSVSYHDTLNEIQLLDIDLYQFLTALDNIRISKSAISYLTTMSIRIWYMHKLLIGTGSFFLHCDSTMSHYLKIVCDIVFGIANFKNEIIWKRTNSLKTSQHKDKKFPVSTDTILFYSKSKNSIFDSDSVKIIFTEQDIINHYHYKDSKGRYTKSPLFRSMGMGERPNLCYEYKGVVAPSKAGWKISKEKLIEYDNNGDIDWSNPKLPYRKYRPEHTKGRLLSNLWDDIDIVAGKERLGYPTQKPIEVLSRIIKATTNEGDIVADFFCGCGTTIASAEKLNRNWVGVDISHLAIKLIFKRLTETYGDFIRNTIEISGFPKDIASAKELARQTDKHRIKFQDWIIEVMVGGVSNPKKSGDGGFDGYITFSKTSDGKAKGIGIIEVKSGNVGISNIRSFIQVVEKQKADLGIFICFAEQVTSGMRIECNRHGKINEWNIDKIQIVTVEELLDGTKLKIPGKSEITVYEKATKGKEKFVREGMF